MVKQKLDNQVRLNTKQLTEDADCQIEDLPKIMENRLLKRESQYGPGNPPSLVGKVR